MKITGIIWLRNIVEKLAWKHNVTTDEVEGVFNHSPRYRFIETGDVEGEDLYAALGQTEAGRLPENNMMKREPIPNHFKRNEPQSAHTCPGRRCRGDHRENFFKSLCSSWPSPPPVPASGAGRAGCGLCLH
jgi:hypothetical protein